MSRSKGSHKIVEKNQFIQAFIAKGKLTPKTHMHIQIACFVIQMQNLCVIMWERERKHCTREGCKGAYKGQNRVIIGLFVENIRKKHHNKHVFSRQQSILWHDVF